MKDRVLQSCAPYAVIVLLMFAIATPTSSAQANIYGQWSTLPYLMPINPVHVALMYNGKVLVVSGSGNDPSNHNLRAAVWDPAAGTITVQTVAWDMFCNGMVVLSDGRAFINGGSIQYDPFLGQTKSSVFDPSNNTFTDVQNMAHGRWYPTVTNLGDGRVMTFSGQDNIDGGTNTDSRDLHHRHGMESAVHGHLDASALSPHALAAQRKGFLFRLDHNLKAVRSECAYLDDRSHDYLQRNQDVRHLGSAALDPRQQLRSPGDHHGGRKSGDGNHRSH